VSKRRITAEMLTQKDACTDQIDRFRERFPDGLDPETVQPEEVVGLDVEWAVHALLPPPAREAFKEAYEEAARKAFKAFREARAPAWEAYKDGGAPSLALNAFKEAEDAALKRYREVRARAAIDLFREYWQKEDHDE